MFSEIFEESADSCIVVSSNSRHKNAKKSWFGKQCGLACKKYHIAKKQHAQLSSSSTKLKHLQASKAYKRKLFFYIQFAKYNKTTQKKLRSLTSKNPKDYWKILNDIGKKQKNENNIELDALYNFLKICMSNLIWITNNRLRTYIFQKIIMMKF